MSLFRFKRTSQPQQATGIDWVNPITRGMVFASCDLMASSSASGHSQIKSGTGFEKSLLQSGIGTRAGSTQATTGVVSLPVLVRDSLVSKPCTFFWLSNGPQPSANGQHIYCHRDSSVQDFVVQFNSTGYSVVVGANTSANVPNIASGNVASAVVLDGASCHVYQNNAKTTNAFAFLPTVSSIIPSVLNRQTGGRGVTAYVPQIAIWNRALSDAEIKSLSDNPWQIFQPTNRAIYPETDASPDITLALTGEDVVAAQGSAAPVITVPLTGVATAVAQGTLTVAGNSDITLPLTGLATVADQGSLLASASIPLTGQATVAARGTLSPETSKELTGQAVALAQGNVSPQASVALTGQAVVAAQGVLVAPGDVTVALTGQGVSLATGLMVGSVTPDAGDAKSGVNRLWLIEYYTKEFAKKEATQVAALEGLTAAAKRKAVKKATVAREAAVEKLVAKAESDLEVLTQGIADVQAAQQFTQALIRQAARRPEPGTDFMQIATDYRKRMRQEDDELLLFSLVI